MLNMHEHQKEAMLVIVDNKCKVTCNKRIYGHRQGSSGSKQVQTNQPILRAVQVDVQIVLGVLNQLSCKKQKQGVRLAVLTCNKAVHGNAEGGSVDDQF